MAVYQYHITKQRDWRGKSERWENTYHYDSQSPITSEQGFIDLLVAIRDIEKIVHGNDVAFVQGRAHGPIEYSGTPPVKNKEVDIMRAVVDWTGQVGVRATGAAVAPELAVITSVLVGRSARGYKQILKKFWHVCRLLDAAAGDDASRGIGIIPGTARTLYSDQFNALRQVLIGGNTNVMCTPQGKLWASGNPSVCQPYLHTRQFRRGRKERP